MSIHTHSSAPPRGATPLLRVEGLDVRYGALVALDDVSWSVAPGELLGIIGPNGAGKSSCFEAVTAMLPRSGRVFFEGRDITATPPHMLVDLGLKRAFQQNAFFDDLSALANMVVALGRQSNPNLVQSVFRPVASARFHQKSAKTAAEQLVRFGIPREFHDMSPKELPYGVQRMLSIALAYGAGARVLLLDEPAAGLGGEDMNRLKELLADLKQEGVAMVVIEHHMDLIMSVADRIFVLDLGKELAYGSPSEVQHDKRVLDAYLGRTE